MEQFLSSMSPKGQVTVPQKIRKMLGLRAKDQVEFRIVAGQVVLTRAESQLGSLFQSVPALPRPISDEEAIAAAWEEHAEEVAKEGFDEE